MSIPYLILFASRNHVAGDYYDVVAQVIPAVLIAVLVDVALSTDRSTSDLGTILIVAFLGEGLALTAVAVPDILGPVGFAFVTASLSAQALALVLSLLWRP
jgi:hypothetical protein